MSFNMLGDIDMVQPHQSHQILVIDDELVLRHLAQTILESVGFRVLTADDGEAGVALYRQRQHEIDLVLLDLALPKMSGQEVMQELCRLNPQVRIVICSAYANGDEEALLQAGACGVLPKPFRVDHLVRTIESSLTPIPG